MEGIRELLTAIRNAGLLVGNFRGVLHLAIGRTVTRPDGTTVSTGLTWRALAAELKNLRFDPELVRELNLDPSELAVRDRERFWYSAIAQAKVDSPEAVAAAEKLVGPLKSLGYVVGPPPAGIASAAPSPPASRGSKPAAETKPPATEEKGKNRKKKKK